MCFTLYSAGEGPGAHVADAVTLVIEGCQRQPAQLVAQAALRDGAAGHRRQGHQTLLHAK